MKNSIKFTPTTQFPEMVTITRGRLRGKRFVNIEMANQFILKLEQEKYSKRFEKQIKYDLQQVIVNEEYFDGY
jgi:hypothetical protein